MNGAGALGTLRGKGTWTSVRLSGTDADPSSITYRSTWQGVTDFDVSPPTIAVSKATARKLRRPKGTFQPTRRTRTLQVKIAATDPVGNAAQLARTLRIR